MTIEQMLTALGQIQAALETLRPTVADDEEHYAAACDATRAVTAAFEAVEALED
jgi:hypothetical protein